MKKRYETTNTIAAHTPGLPIWQGFHELCLSKEGEDNKAKCQKTRKLKYEWNVCLKLD